ncbi:hypothetical protein L596_009816 [Steinernema carpocapsae]|uniref:Uncharacterized protein n=1 Tax=Steinernema carpocapsae TaxID=34508 RepID=A0A4U5PHS6_STECR|nr:hypothetical protein L596_009816 [Steinernema carpocapsae]
MDNVPYEFASAVAHLGTRKTVSELSRMGENMWSSVGETHKEKRRNHELRVFLSEEGIFGLVGTGKTHLIREFVRKEESFERIDTVFLYKAPRSLCKEECNEAELRLISEVLKNQPIKKLVVQRSLATKDLSKADFLWQMEFESVAIPSGLAHKALIDFHLLENQKLKKFVVSALDSFGYDFVKKTAEAWKFGKKMSEPEFKKSCKKDFEDLCDLGFQPKNVSIKDLWIVGDGAKRGLLIRAMKTG